MKNCFCDFGSVCPLVRCPTDGLSLHPRPRFTTGTGAGDSELELECSESELSGDTELVRLRIELADEDTLRALHFLYGLRFQHCTVVFGLSVVLRPPLPTLQQMLHAATSKPRLLVLRTHVCASAQESAIERHHLAVGHRMLARRMLMEATHLSPRRLLVRFANTFLHHSLKRIVPLWRLPEAGTRPLLRPEMHQPALLAPSTAQQALRLRTKIRRHLWRRADGAGRGGAAF